MDISKEHDAMGDFLIGRFRAIPPEQLLDVTQEVVRSMTAHLTMLVASLRHCGQLSTEELTELQAQVLKAFE